jgi:peptidoglycan hydrolase-like protein with peptidoglycan-binding domain
MPGSHSRVPRRANGGSRTRSSRGWITAIVAASVAVVAVGVAAVVVRPTSHSTAAPTATSNGAVEASKHVGPFTVVATSPAAGSTGVATDASVSVTLSAPVAPTSPAPSLSPAVAGTWELVTPTTFLFVASAPFVPSTHETVTVPGGAGGVVSTTGQHLAAATTDGFTVAIGTYLRLQQLLAEAGYLPLTFTPTAPLANPALAAEPQEGTFSWKWAPPAFLASQWTPGSANVVTTGAVMAFEDHNGLATDGIAGPQVWQKLLADVAAGTVDPSPYDYVYVSKNLPETATVYRNGQQVYSTPANTGVPGAVTASGTYPVYLRYKVTTMTGTNPNGTHYHDTGIPWVSYFNGGDALHGFVRASYGFPQSNGCVEMPPANAAVVYPLTPIGTLVTVS